MQLALEMKASENKSTKGCGGHPSTAPSLQRSRSDLGSSGAVPACPSLRIFLFAFYILPLISPLLPPPSLAHTYTLPHLPQPEINISNCLTLTCEICTPRPQRRTEVTRLEARWPLGTETWAPILALLFTNRGTLRWIA